MSAFSIDKLILSIAVFTPVRRLFHYRPLQPIDPEMLKPGIRVLVPFQSRKIIGILISIEQESTYSLNKLKSVIEYLDETPQLTSDIFNLCSWAADYYHTSLGEVLMSALPNKLRKINAKLTHEEILSKTNHNLKLEKKLPLNHEQQHAVDEILKFEHHYKTFLLEGVTGSGKTEVYLQVIETFFANNKQVLVMVPEISLTPQTIERFRQRFNQTMGVLHSGLTEKKRLATWQAAKNGSIQLILGTRSAVFTPFNNLGLIVIDEEHDLSFKQQDRFRYHGRDVAIKRANQLNIPIILGSATPSLESLLNVKKNRYHHLLLTKRAGKADLPTYQLINIKQETVMQGLSFTLIEKMREHLSKKKHVLLFINRRGFAPLFYCTQCTWKPTCSRCDAYLVYHRSPKELRCHHCDYRVPVMLHCKACGDNNMLPIGVGTQRLESALMEYFPHIPILRFDRDETRLKGQLNELLKKVAETECAILLGTQMLAKGHHFPRVTLVGIIDTDAGLFSADFHAIENMGQMIVQVSGRAGREEEKGIVLLQTRHPDHALLNTLLAQGYGLFAQQLLAEREAMHLPPYSYTAIIRAEARVAHQAKTFLVKIKNHFKNSPMIDILGPATAILAKKKGLYCEQLLLKSKHRVLLQHFLSELIIWLEQYPPRSVKWILEVDPLVA